MDSFNDFEEEDDDSNEFQAFAFSKEALIVLIDNSNMMHKKDSKNENAFYISLKCAWIIIRNNIINNDQNIISIVLYGNKPSQKSEFEHVKIIHELGLPSGKKLIELERIIQNNCEEFQRNASNDSVTLSEALWACSNIFSSSKNQNYYKRIFIFTNNDEPYGNSKEKKKQLLSRFNDLEQNNIEVVLMHIQPVDKIFDFDLQYKEILIPYCDNFNGYPNACSSYEDLVNRIQYNNYKKRKFGKVPFIFRDDFRMTVSLYKQYHPSRKPAPIKLYKNTNEEITSNSKTFLLSNLELLGPQDFKKCLIYLDKKICFFKDEISEIKNDQETGFHLIGFIHHSMVKTEKHVASAKFIYPEESMIKGSTTLFTALLEQMLASKNVAICKFVPSKNQEPRIVALFPQEEKFDEHKLQICPPGFHVVIIPFVDDLRKLSLEPNTKTASNVQVEKAKDLIKKLQFKFSCENFENPSLQKHFIDVEAIALEKTAPENFKDYTERDDELIEKKVGQLVEEFNCLFDHCATTKKKKVPTATLR